MINTLKCKRKSAFFRHHTNGKNPYFMKIESSPLFQLRNCEKERGLSFQFKFKRLYK